MPLELGKGRRTRRVYGFDEIALVPSMMTVETDEVSTSVKIAGFELKAPIIASAMDSVVDPTTAALMTQYGGLGVLNLQGVQTRYEDPDKILDQIGMAPKEEYVPLMQKIYAEDIKESLIIKRIKQIKEKGGIAAVSVTPQKAMDYGKIAESAGADILFVQATVVSTLHKTKMFKPLNLKDLIRSLRIPVVVGNCVTYEVTQELIKSGAAAVLVGIGPGAACTSRGVLGIGIPMATAISDCAAARDDYYKKHRKWLQDV